MLSFICYLIATIVFFLIGYDDKATVDAAWGFFFVSLGLAFSTLSSFVTGVKSRV